MLKVLVTGAAGFVGHYLTEYLNQNDCEVWGVYNTSHSNSNERMIKTDITNSSEVNHLIRSIKPDLVYNLAGISNVAKSWEEINGTYNTNVMGTVNLVDAILSHIPKATLINIGSSEEYGIPLEIPTNEKHPTNPVTPYGVSKFAAGQSVIQYNKKYGLRAIHVRAFNHIGPKQAKGFVTSDFAQQIVKIEKLLLSSNISVGNLSAKRDFTDVRDVVNAYWMLYKSGKPGEVYNVCSGNTLSIEEILKYFISLSNIDIKVVQDPTKFRIVDIPAIKGDASKLTRDTGWKPKIQIKDSLRDILEYWRNHPEEI